MIATLVLPPVPVATDPRAFAQAAAELRPYIRAVVAAVLRESREHPDVEDCTHEALRRAIEGRERLREGEAMRAWVVSIARHVALDALRARQRARARTARGSEGEDDADDLLGRLADLAPGPE